MIIWGTRGITSTVEESTFHCPQCRTQRDGRLKQVRRFFTLYFIPIIPLDVAGRYVECTGCAGTYAEEILQYDPVAEQQKTFDEMLRVMILAALADGQVDTDERSEIKRQYTAMAGLPVSEDKLDEEVRFAVQSGTTLNDFVAKVAPDYSPQGKGLVIRLTYSVMSAHGPLEQGHKQQLAGLAKTLGIPDDQFLDFLRQLREEANEELV